LTENWSAALPADRQQEIHHRYALGLYDLCERIIEANPTVFFEGCAGGGGRFDPALLHYFPQYWTSDDTDAYMRTQVQYGTSIVYPPSTISCHTSICPNHQTGRTTPFATRADIAHFGPTGYELDTTKMTAEEKESVRGQVDAFREMEDLVVSGDLYRFEDPHTSNYFAVAHVAKDKSRAVITAFRALVRANDENKRIYPRGLDADTVYYVRELDAKLSGATLMQVGISLPNDPVDFKTFVFHLSKV
jgi:alpha-galactosidase